ncbi:MAG: dual specificity protein phosphatase family protein [Dissulfurimicrobium sp.]|uniref:dual specificity protein phosphatase family protein n=1 Tax=Dissulfurimicrobium sp. TaxID=2022436 RepID=UPI0040495A58
MRRFKFSIPLLLFFSVLAVLSAIYFLYMEEQGNFHVITPGEAYRSAQMDRDELEYYITKYGIRSILNLRGENADKPWYVEELDVSRAHNVAHYDISLATSRELNSDDVIKLVEIFKTAPRPILIHCKSGADRSGLVAAMWKVIVDKEPKAEAAKQLSIIYGHMPIGKATAMDHFFDKWDPNNAILLFDKR